MALKVHKQLDKLGAKRFQQFMIAGSLNTLFGFSVYSICIIVGIPLWLSLLISMFFGIIFNFITTGSYVFRQLSLVRFPRFLLCYVIIYIINIFFVELISMWIKNEIFIQAMIALPLALLSYYIMSTFVFIALKQSDNK